MPRRTHPNSDAKVLTHIANELYDADRIHAEMKAEGQRKVGVNREVQPTTEGSITEKQIAAIWAEVLGIEQVGLHDNFFDIGGHSLVAVQIISRLHDAFGVELPIDVVFNGEVTVRDLAREIEHRQISQCSSEEVAQLLEEVAALSDAEVAEWLTTSGPARTGTTSGFQVDGTASRRDPSDGLPRTENH